MHENKIVFSHCENINEKEKSNKKTDVVHVYFSLKELINAKRTIFIF
jgi:hypothetical protein